MSRSPDQRGVEQTADQCADGKRDRTYIAGQQQCPANCRNRTVDRKHCQNGDTRGRIRRTGVIDGAEARRGSAQVGTLSNCETMDMTVHWKWSSRSCQCCWL